MRLSSFLDQLDRHLVSRWAIELPTWTVDMTPGQICFGAPPLALDVSDRAPLPPGDDSTSH